MSDTSERKVREQLLEYLVDRPHMMLRGITSNTGSDFLRWLTCCLQEALGVDCAYVGELWGEKSQWVRTLAVHTSKGPQDNFEHELRKTVAADIVNKGSCIVPFNLASRYPQDTALTRMGADSLVGLRLTDGTDRPLGLMVVADEKPMSEDQVHLAQSTLELMRPRVEIEMDRRRALHDMNMVLGSGRATDDKDRILALSMTLAHTMHVKTAFVSRFTDEARTRLRTLALVVDGEARDNITYDVQGTPCERVYQDEVLLHDHGVQQKYPNDAFLVSVNAESYMARAFFDRDGSPLGHVGILHDRPLPPRLKEQSLFSVFASRIFAELQHLDVEQQRRSMEKLMQARQKMESLGVLAGGIAHDFNNLLTSMLSNAELALATLPKSATQREHLAAIATAARRAADLCKQMLAYAGRDTLLPRRLDLNHLVREIVELLEVSLSKKCRMHLDLAEELPAVAIDVSQIHQVVLNLVTNAADAVGKDVGSVRISTSKVHCTSTDLKERLLGEDLAPGTYVRLQVADSGHGIAEQDLGRIFDPFFSTKNDGHGLGLAAVLGIVRGHRGAIQVATEPDEGTTFDVYLPAASLPKEDPHKPPPSRSESSSGQTVLVVDDEPAILRVASLILRAAGYTVLVAGDGREALDVFRRERERISAVLLDLSMPKMGGEETLRELRRMGSEVPVVLSSGFAEQEVMSRIAPDDVTAVARKPYDMEQLRRLVDDAVAAGQGLC